MEQADTSSAAEFSGGKRDFDAAAGVACACSGYRPDDDGEWVADEPRSCYNGRARRWTPRTN